MTSRTLLTVITLVCVIVAVAAALISKKAAAHDVSKRPQPNADEQNGCEEDEDLRPAAFPDLAKHMPSARPGRGTQRGADLVAV